MFTDESHIISSLINSYNNDICLTRKHIVFNFMLGKWIMRIEILFYLEECQFFYALITLHDLSVLQNDSCGYFCHL